jgi:hypothetical protein
MGFERAIVPAPTRGARPAGVPPTRGDMEVVAVATLRDAVGAALDGRR